MKTIAEILYEAYQNKRENAVMLRPEKFDKVEKEFMLTFNRKQFSLYLKLESLIYETIKLNQINVIEYMLQLICKEEE